MGEHVVIGVALERAGCRVLEQLLDGWKQLHQHARGREITADAAIDELLESRLELGHALAPALLGDDHRLIEHREQGRGEVAPSARSPARIARFAFFEASGDGWFAKAHFIVALSHAPPRLSHGQRAPAPRAGQSSRRWRAGAPPRRYASASGESPHRHRADQAPSHNTRALRARRLATWYRCPKRRRAPRRCAWSNRVARRPPAAPAYRSDATPTDRLLRRCARYGCRDSSSWSGGDRGGRARHCCNERP